MVVIVVANVRVVKRFLISEKAPGETVVIIRTHHKIVVILAIVIFLILIFIAPGLSGV